MENRINQVITIEGGKKFMILHQAIYNSTNYYVCTAVTEDETDLTDDFVLFEEVKNGDKYFLKIVEDEEMAKFIFEHLDLMDEDEN